MNHLFPGRVVEESRKEIEALLSGFGLSGNEVKALITIVKLGRVKASVLARETGIPRPEIYRILRKLEGRGIIRVRLSHPKEFFAIEPEKIVNRLLGSIQDKVIKLVAKRERLISSLGSLSIRVVEPDESLEVISGGLQAVYRKMSEMGRHAGRRVDYLTSSTGMHIADYSGLLDVLRERSKDINVRIITEFDAEALFNTEVSLSNLISIRYLQRTPFSIFIVDREEAIVGVTPKMERWKSSDDSCKDIWTNDRNWIELYQRLFDSLWDSASSSPIADALIGTKPSLENAPPVKRGEGVWIVDVNFNTIYVNRRAAEMLGYEPKEMIGKNIEFFCDEKWKKKLRNLQDRRRRGISEIHKFQFLKKDSNKIETLIHTEPIFNEENQFVGAIGILRETLKAEIKEASRSD